MKNKNKEKKENSNKVKFTEKVSLTFRKKWLVNGTKTLLIVAILVAAYIALNLGVKQLDLPEIDVTENQVYTLTDASKKAISTLNQDIKIYVYGYEEDSTLVGLLKQYSKANDKIKYEMLTSESNYGLVQEYGLQSGYQVIILTSGDTKKLVDSSNFYSFDYTTYQQIDMTEQVITNSILALNEENKPKVYFVQGHDEYRTTDALKSLEVYLKNEAFETETLDIATKGAIPEDCDILAIMSPTSDYIESEAQAIKDYINKGGNIYLSMDVVSETTALPNFQTILDEYGVSVENGYIVEYAEDRALAKYPQIFRPEVSSENKITADIFTDSYMWLAFAGRLNFKDDDTLKNLNIEKEVLLSSSEESAFITDLNADMTKAAETAQVGKSNIAALMTKTISKGENAEDSVQSKMVITASGSFNTDYVLKELSESAPLSAQGSNRDFTINAMSLLGDKENILTIRKDMSNSTYTPTEQQNIIVLTIIFSVPLIIIFFGIIIWAYRKKRK